MLRVQSVAGTTPASMWDLSGLVSVRVMVGVALPYSSSPVDASESVEDMSRAGSVSPWSVLVKSARSMRVNWTV